MHKIVDQLDPFVLVIMPSLVLLAFFLQAKYLGTPLLSKYFNFPKWEPRPIFKTGDLPKIKYL
jgi:hypothetical protein